MISIQAKDVHPGTRAQAQQGRHPERPQQLLGGAGCLELESLHVFNLPFGTTGVYGQVPVPELGGL
jgi:hypothetical protein